VAKLLGNEGVNQVDDADGSREQRVA
jgi:hypothetical protein